MVLSRVHVRAAHVHGRDAEEAGVSAGEGDFTAAVAVAVELGFGDPALVESLEDVGAEILVVRAAGTVLGVEVDFEIFPWCSALGLSLDAVAERHCDDSQILHLGEELLASSGELLSGGVSSQIKDARLVAIRRSCHCSSKRRVVPPVKNVNERLSDSDNQDPSVEPSVTERHSLYPVLHTQLTTEPMLCGWLRMVHAVFCSGSIFGQKFVASWRVSLLTTSIP